MLATSLTAAVLGVEAHLVSDDVRVRSPADQAEGDDRGGGGEVHLPAHDGLDGVHDLGGWNRTNENQNKNK